MTKKETVEAVEKKKDGKVKETKSVDELILDYGVGKYSAIPLTAIWAKELRRREEHRHLTSNEILELALTDVLSGDIGWKDVKKAYATGVAQEAAMAAEEKAKAK